MASSARIEELERKFNENPRRYFAPLANEYRKAGDLEQAIAICRTYVPQQPAHMSGHIVFGQALFEAGEHEEARGVFEAALALDPENLIALRHLGDIARERGEVSAARTWYQRVLDADPRNEEVTALVSGLDTPSAPRDTSPGVATWADINPERTLELPPGLLESVSRDIAGGSPKSTPSLTAASDASGGSSPHEPTLQPPPPTTARAGWPHETPVTADEIPGPGLLDLEPMDVTVPPAAAHVSPSVAVPVVSGEALEAPQEGGQAAGGTSAALPDVETEVATGAAPLGLEPMEFVAPPHASAHASVDASHPSETSVPAIDSQASSTAAFAGPGLSTASAPTDRGDRDIGVASEEPPAAFVTETMAELYLQQGFREEALSVYRLLLAQNPADVTLQERVTHLERVPAGAMPSGSSPAIGGETTSGSGTSTTPGQVTVRQFFADLARRRLAPLATTGEDGGPAAEPGTGFLDSSAASEGTAFESVAASGPGWGDNASGAATFDTGVHTQPPATAESGVPEVGSSQDATGAETQPPGSAEHAGGAAIMHAVAASIEMSIDDPHAVSLGSPRFTSDVGDVSVLDGFSYGVRPSDAAPGAYQYDVASYDAEDMSGVHTDPAADGSSETGAGATGADASGNETLDTTSPATHSEQAAPMHVERPPADSHGQNGADPELGTRKPMQTGSVNVLFPQQAVVPADESAAATLSDAFGGPTQPLTSGAGRPARPAVNELSLDSIFGESAPPAEPRRGPGAFSFDQFFTDTPGATSTSASSGASGTPPRTDAGSDPTDAISADAEQFSNWLAGLKKK